MPDEEDGLGGGGWLCRLFRKHRCHPSRPAQPADQPEEAEEEIAHLPHHLVQHDQQPVVRALDVGEARRGTVPAGRGGQATVLAVQALHCRA
eukprot:scaffold224466_cov33-Tisochrysis_lutea.AAC.1